MYIIIVISRLGLIKDMDSDKVDPIYSVSPVGLYMAMHSVSNPSYIKCVT